jgi:hypothetical protein
MYFYVFFQPDVFDEALADGEDAIQNVASILSNLLQNCLLAVFEDDRWGSAVRAKLEGWPETLCRRRIMSILKKFRLRNRFVYCLVPAYDGSMCDIDCVFQQAPGVPLDLIVVVAAESGRPVPAGSEVTTRANYQTTAFEPVRSDLAVDGKTCAPGVLSETDFMDFHFLKAVKHATAIHICDRVCGAHNYADNFKYTTERLMAWLEQNLFDPAGCKLCFHLGLPRGHGDAYIRAELAALKKGRLAGIQLEVCFYDEALPDPTLPHQRFVLTDQVALDIDRGLDFLDRTTHRNRDTYVNYQNRDEAEALLASCVSNRVSATIV